MKKNNNKILILALSGIGDALMFTPAIVKLREIYPDAQIDALVMFKGAYDIYNRLPELNNLIHFDFLNEGAFNSLKFVFSLRGNYDKVINVYPANRREYNIINWIIGSKERAAVRYLRNDFINLGFLNNRTITENDSLHNVEENISLIEKLSGEKINEIPALKFPLQNDELKFAEKYLSNLNIGSETVLIGFHPGCNTLKNHANRRWDTENFAALANKLIEEKNAFILIFGGLEEKELKASVKESINSSRAAAVETGSFAESAAVMAKCDVFVSNDSSLMHTAAALQLNTVAVIGPTNTNYIHPWKTNFKIASINLDCAPCFYYSPRPLTCIRTDKKWKCIKDLPVELVYNEVLEFID